MRLSYILVVAACLFAVGETFSSDTDQVDTLSSIQEDNAPGATRSLRAEVKVTMELAGLLHDSAQSKKLLQLWLNNGESVARVATKLKVYNLPQQVAVEHANWNALVKYMRMSVRSKHPDFFAKFGSGYQSKARTEEWAMRWAIDRKTDDYVAGMLNMAHLPRSEYKMHKNYRAFQLFRYYRKSVEQIRASAA